MAWHMAGILHMAGTLHMAGILHAQLSAIWLEYGLAQLLSWALHYYHIPGSLV